MEDRQASLDDAIVADVAREPGDSSGESDVVVRTGGAEGRAERAVTLDDVEDVVDEKIREDVYPRLSKIYESLDYEVDAGAQVPDEIELSPEVREFYEAYSRAFDSSVAELAAELLEEEARSISEELECVSGETPDWLLR